MMFVFLALVGLSLGSFVNAFVWRLRLGKNWWSERSQCPSCQHQLAWYDLVPVVSWLALRGHCRYCAKPISLQYPLVELVVAILFSVSYIWWPYSLSLPQEWLYFGLFLLAIVIMVALAVYDIHWFELPEPLTALLAVIGVSMMSLKVCGLEVCQADSLGWQMVWSLLPIAGLYGLLHLVSNGKWVGIGDVKLGIGLGFILGWKLAVVAVFLANVIGIIYVLPQIIRRKISSKSHIPFGPFLIIATWLCFFVGEAIASAYLGFIGI